MICTTILLQKSLSEYETMSNLVLFSCRCYLGHVNMSLVTLEQCVADVFTNNNIENKQRSRRYNSYHKFNPMPKKVVESSKNFNPGVMLALDQIITKNPNGEQYILIICFY